MFWLADRLAIELEKQIRMAGFQKCRLQNLMAGCARRRPHIQTAQIAHPGADASVVSPIFSRVTAEPSARRAVAVLTRNTLVRMRLRSKPAWRDRLERRMTHGAARA